ncbi:MAG TPA: TolC family protein [Smithellaceae bacterium]|nr:TolC family protein [Smithellaceae bacterium]
MRSKYLLSALVLLLGITFFAVSGWTEEILTLDSSIELALKNSSVINIAKEGAKSAVARKKEAFTGFLPKFSTSYYYQYLNDQPSMIFPGVPPAIPASTIILGTQNNYNWVTEVKQPLFTGGGILANYQASKIGEDIAMLEVEASRQDVVREVTIAYFDILRSQKILETAQQSVAMLTAHRERAQNYFKVGMIPKNDLLHAEVELANGRQSLTKAANAVEMAKSHMNIVLRRSIAAPVRVEDNLVYRPLGSSLAECLETAAKRRPEVKISELKAAQAGKIVRAAQSEYLPTLSALGNYSRYGDDFSVSGSNYKNMESWYIMAVASWNFWEWGKTKHKVDAGKSRENQALEAAKELNDQITLEIKGAYLNMREAEAQITVSGKVIEQAEENYRIAEERFQERVATTTEVLDAQTLLTKAKAQYANALADYNISGARLQRAMGTIGKQAGSED